ncbi:MAG TPA: CAP domain-containing protein [Thermoanaerobaculia bacterium]
MKTLRGVLYLVAITALATGAAADAANQITAENILRLMNEYRSNAGLPLLNSETRLEQAAADRMRHMEEVGYWNHTSPDGMSPFVWMAVRAYRFQYASENLASGFETARLLVESWMESPGHRANILSPDAEDCGIAVIEGATTGPSVGKSVVVLFGKRQPFTVITSSTRR